MIESPISGKHVAEQPQPMSITERIKLVIQVRISDRSRYVDLQQITGISGNIWKNFWHARREPSAEMLESIAKTWPEYALWLTTGILYPAIGQIRPSSDRFRHDLSEEMPWTTKLLKLKIEFENYCQKEGIDSEHVVKETSKVPEPLINSLIKHSNMSKQEIISFLQEKKTDNEFQYDCHDEDFVSDAPPKFTAS
ncbi:hypothetical protein R6242_03560 [Iodobacter sp. CM08]|uniref:hypothetical protein n=1 Tax=Iodobacter sp. CM08 TaxID=3085902 RepID=UPI0029823393|nr:hypothetical protein [Iodobacter sp. CM08]MDW5415646.1 hypothetical protein [Iodobacter sp. CM08]